MIRFEIFADANGDGSDDGASNDYSNWDPVDCVEAERCVGEDESGSRGGDVSPEFLLADPGSVRVGRAFDYLFHPLRSNFHHHGLVGGEAQGAALDLLALQATADGEFDVGFFGEGPVS